MNTKKLHQVIFLSVLFTFFFSCKRPFNKEFNQTVPPTEMKDSSLSVESDTSVKHNHQLKHSTNKGADRSPASVEEDTITVPLVGSVAYYVPPKMIKDQEYFITVSISKEALSKLIGDVQREVAQTNPTSNLSDVKGDSIFLADKMKVELVYSGDYFKEVSTPQNLEQTFGINNTLEWDWLVQPLAVNRSIPIEIRISAFNLHGDGKWSDAKQPYKLFYINVEVDPRTFWDKVLTFLSGDPKFLLAQILIPLFTFLGGIWLGKRKSK